MKGILKFLALAVVCFVAGAATTFDYGSLDVRLVSLGNIPMIEVSSSNKRVETVELSKLSLDEKVSMAEIIFGKNLNIIPGYTAFREGNIYEVPYASPPEAHTPNFAVDNFMCQKGQEYIPGDSLRQAIVASYPKNWTNILDSITQVNVESDAWAICSYNTSSKRVKIFFYECSFKEKLPDNIHSTLSHELGHANDWAKKNCLSFEQRIDLLLRVYERVQASDRYFSKYNVENISIPENLQLEHWRKATEYWAEICSVFFQCALQKLTPEDIALVDWRIKLDDPAYDVIASYHKRKKAVGGSWCGFRTRQQYETALIQERNTLEYKKHFCD